MSHKKSNIVTRQPASAPMAEPAEEPSALNQNDGVTPGVSLDSAETSVDEERPLVAHGIVTWFFVWLLGGKPHLFGQCSKSTMGQRGAIGAMFFFATLLDWCITSVALYPIVGWWSTAVASGITLFVVSIDRGIFVSVDGGRKPNRLVLVARLSLAVLQIMFMGLALLVAISNNMVDRTIAEAHIAQLAEFDSKIAQANQAFVDWQTAQQTVINAAQQMLTDERQHCQDEMTSTAKVGRHGKPTTGIVGVGPVAQACKENVEKMEADLASQKEQSAALEEVRRDQYDQTVATLTGQKKTIEALQQTGKQQTGMLDRFVVLVAEGKKIVHANAGAVWIVGGLEALFAILLGNVFISKLTLERDEYDIAFRKDKRMDAVEAEWAETAAARQHAEEEAELLGREQALEREKRLAELEAEELRHAVGVAETKAEVLEKLATARERLAEAQRMADAQDAKYPAKPQPGKGKRRR